MTVTVPTPAPTRTRRRATRPATGEPDTALLPDAPEAPAPPVSPALPTERPGRRRSAAAERAYARRAQREGRAPERAEQADTPTGRARFVVLIIGLLVVGIAATLWLSTQAISDSYKLEEVRQDANDLSERADTLQREVTKLDSPAALAERARELGMVFPGDPARLIVQPDGTIAVVGEPKPAAAPPPPPASDQQAPPAGEQVQPPAGGQEPQPQAGGPAPGAG